MNFLLRVNVITLFLFLAGCFNDVSAPTDAPTNITVLAGENLIAVDWDVQPGRDYWVFYNQGTNVSLDDNEGIKMGVEPPYLLFGLDNDTQYALAVTSSQGGSQVGPFSEVVMATPRLLDPEIDWLVGTSLTVNNLQSIAFGNDYYVTVGETGTLFVAPYSYMEVGAVTGWTQIDSLPVDLTTNFNSVVYDGIRFLALGDDGSIIISTDTDDEIETEIWEAATAIVDAPVMNTITLGAGIYIAVGDDGAIYTNDSDAAAEDWVEQVSGTTNNLYNVSYVYDRFFAVGELGTIITSTDGEVWEIQTTGTSNDLRQVAYGAENYVAIGDAGTIVSSTDAIAWNVQTIPTTESFRSICFGPDEQFIAVGTTGVLAYSVTGEDGSWAISNAGSIDLNSIACNVAFIATGAAGANVSGK